MTKYVTKKQKDVEIEYIELCRKKLDALISKKETEIDIIASDNTRFTLPFNDALAAAIEHTLKQEFERVKALRVYDDWSNDSIEDLWRDFY